MEHVIPIPKVPSPESEDDLRPISLTPLFSKVAEHFVVSWLLDHIGHKLDFRQYGGLKGNSITHYIIEFVNFILSCQDSTEQTAILACMVDFSKAFNRQNHNILITKLSDMGVPGWLLRIVMSFLSDRKMKVRFKGKTSIIKSLPGGGPQGTLLALLLFIVLINDIGFEGQENNAGELITCKKNLKSANEIHLKFVDDLTLAESINLQKQLVKVPDNARPRPDNYHARTGHALPVQNSKVARQLEKTRKQASNNEMKLNYKKTKVMIFNPCRNIDFMPEICIEGNELEVVEEMRLLGLIIRSDMRWTSNTENMIKKASKRLWMLRRLKYLGASELDLVDVYTKQIRCVLELAAPAWQGSISQAEKQDLERIQKCAAHIILGDVYTSYQSAMSLLNLDTWFKLATKKTNTRSKMPKYYDVKANYTRFAKSPLSYITRLLNTHHMK